MERREGSLPVPFFALLAPPESECFQFSLIVGKCSSGVWMFLK